MKINTLPFPASLLLKKEIEDLFKALQKESRGYYPLQAATDEVGGISEWLALDQEKLRFGYFKTGALVGYVEVDFLADLTTPEKKEHWQSKFPGRDINTIAVLKRLAVAPNFKREGVGSALIRAGVAAAPEHTVGGVVLAGLAPAISLYEKEGAVRVSESDDLGFKIYSYILPQHQDQLGVWQP